jgi:hypothetical protein
MKSVKAYTTGRNVFLIILMLSIILLPVITGIIGLFIGRDGDNLPDNIDFSMISNFSMVLIDWISVRQTAVVLRFGISIFALFVVYLGGRSKAKRFNDRTIELIKSLKVVFIMAALFRAAFNFNSMIPICKSYDKPFDQPFHPSAISYKEVLNHDKRNS